jgi:hypothetical protein
VSSPLSMAVVIATMQKIVPNGVHGGDEVHKHSWYPATLAGTINLDSDYPCPFFHIVDNSVENKGVIGSYEEAWRACSDKTNLFAFIHDDVQMHQSWTTRVYEQFEDPKVGVVGFGGARIHGDPDIYKKPYQLTQLGRGDYFSNVDDAETHGTRFDGAMDVAVLDGFSLVVRRELLEKMGGWQPEKWPPHHVYDYRVCLEAHRHGYKVQVVGVKCHHHGGRTATTSEYQKWADATQWGSDVGMHKAGHRMIYDEYRDVLPVNV